MLLYLRWIIVYTGPSYNYKSKPPNSYMCCCIFLLYFLLTIYGGVIYRWCTKQMNQPGILCNRLSFQLILYSAWIPSEIIVGLFRPVFSCQVCGDRVIPCNFERRVTKFGKEIPLFTLPYKWQQWCLVSISSVGWLWAECHLHIVTSTQVHTALVGC